MSDHALVQWLSTFAPDGAAGECLQDFSDGEVLLCVAQDVIEGFDFASAPSGLGGVHASLEHAFGVRFSRLSRAQREVSAR